MAPWLGFIVGWQMNSKDVIFIHLSSPFLFSNVQSYETLQRFLENTFCACRKKSVILHLDYNDITNFKFKRE